MPIRIVQEINVPTGLDKIPALSAEAHAYREEFIAWAIDNGLTDHSSEDVSTTKRTSVLVWESEAKLTAFLEKFGPGYSSYMSKLIASINSVGGTFSRVVER